MNECTLVIAHSSQTRLPQRRLGSIKGNRRGLGKGEFLIVYDSLTTLLTSAGWVEESSMG